MQIILLEKVGTLGALGDVVNVKNGYARNYLIPQGKAKRANKENLAEFETRRAEFEARQAEILRVAAEGKAKLDGQTLTVAQKAGVDGRLFGSVTTADIADAAKALGVEVAKSAVRLPDGPLKAVGEYDIEIALHHDAVATVKVAVVPLEDK